MSFSTRISIEPSFSKKKHIEQVGEAKPCQAKPRCAYNRYFIKIQYDILDLRANSAMHPTYYKFISFLFLL